MLADGGYFDPEKLRHGLLRKPNRFVFNKDFNIHLPIVSGVEKEVCLVGREIFFIHGSFPSAFLTINGIPGTSFVGVGSALDLGQNPNHFEILFYLGSDRKPHYPEGRGPSSGTAGAIGTGLFLTKRPRNRSQVQGSTFRVKDKEGIRGPKSSYETT